MSYEQHQKQSQALAARFAVITSSDTRTPETDESGKTIRQALIAHGHAQVEYQIIKDEPVTLSALLENLLNRDDIDLIITNGGTGISRRDQTIETVHKFLDQELPGFGELFRMLSWEQIGSGAMLSRATAGIARGKIIFALPGSSKAVELAMQELILPEVGHLIAELKK